MENVTVAADGKINFADKSVTENTRVSYPSTTSKTSLMIRSHQGLITHNLTVYCLVSILNLEQTQYYFLSGFTAKLAGTERGILNRLRHSACFGAVVSAPTCEELVKKTRKTGAKAYAVNTGSNRRQRILSAILVVSSTLSEWIYR
ncbi:MAG: phosphoenolpyruvate carboxykinase (ATP) [Bacteroides fragilis]